MKSQTPTCACNGSITRCQMLLQWIPIAVSIGNLAVNAASLLAQRF